MGNTELVVEEVKVVAGRGLEESHPHDPHSHHPEVLRSRCVERRRTPPESCVRLWQEFRQLESEVSN